MKLLHNLIMIHFFCLQSLLMIVGSCWATTNGHSVNKLPDTRSLGIVLGEQSVLHCVILVKLHVQKGPYINGELQLI